MKDSGIEWIGIIPENWDIDNIGSIYKERKEKCNDTDYAPLSVTMQGIVPQLSTAAKTDAHDDRKLVRKGDFAINSRSDRRGSCGISPQDGSVSLINTVLIPKSEMNPGFYNWLFHSDMFSSEFYKWGHGIVDDLWTTNWQDMKAISVPVPSREEQARIADFLDKKASEIDAVISKTKESIEEYKKLKQSTITEAVTKGLDPNVETKDSGIEWIGDTPKHWTLGRIKNCFNVFSGATPKSDNTAFWDGDIKWITPADFKTEDIYVSTGNRNISEEGYNSCGTTIVPEGSVIFSKRAPIGTVAISLTDLCTNQGCLSCVPFDNTDSKFFYYFFSVFTEQFNLFGTGTTFKEISYDNFINFRILIPEKEEQKQIVKYLDTQCSKYNSLISKKEQVISELEQYKKSLIYEYVTGKKEVS